MRRPCLSALSALGLAVIAAPAWAGGVRLGDHQCDYRSNYDVAVADDGVRFAREEATPRRVFMHDGVLRVDGREVALSPADARSLRQYEAGMRWVVPEVAGITRAGVDIGFVAMTTVAATFASDGDRRDIMQRLDRKHASALREIDRSLGSGQWRRDAMGELIGDAIGDTVPELVSTVTARAVKAAMSGDEAQLKALQARADSLDDSIDRQMEARSDKLEARAEGLCARLAQLQARQAQWQFRLADGSRLKLLRKQPHERDDPTDGDSDVDVVMW